MTTEERLAALHTKMNERRRMRERRRTGYIGACCVLLSVCLVLLIFGSGAHNCASAGIFSGSMMLFEGSGGYVLIAVVAFMAGAAITILLIKKKERDAKSKEEITPENASDSKEENQT
jgi:hypothetical protein